MNQAIETIIVKSFFTKRIQDRILFELASTKKRQNVLHRLCHRYQSTLREEYMIDISHQASHHNDIAILLKQYGAEDTCYAISWSDELGGKELPLLTALEKATHIGMPSIISCIPNKLVFFQAEQESLPCPRFILRREN